MFRTNRITTTIGLSAATLLLLAACQAGGASPASSESAAASSAASAQASVAEPSADGSAPTSSGTVEVATSATLDDYLTDADGRTLYIFLNDSPGVTSCFDTCLQSWPPFTVDAGTSPTAGDGITAALGTIQRDDGSTQVTLDGWPLYYFVADATPGDTNGQGVGDVWYVARPDGSVPGAAASRSAYDY